MSVWNETVKPLPKEVADVFIDAAKYLEGITKEEFEKRRRERQENCPHDGKVYSFGPTLDRGLDVQIYFCGVCDLETDEPIGRYKGTKPMNRNDLNRMIRNTYVD